MPSSPRLPEVSLVIPCYNEQECLRQTVTELLDAFGGAGIAAELVLVDNGSRDQTGAIIDDLRNCGLPIVKVVVPVNLGYGHGILSGLKQCTAPLVGYLCADGQVPAEAAAEVCRLARGATVPVLAKVRRRFRKDSYQRKFVSVVYNLGMQLAFGWLGSLDLNGSPKIMSRDSMIAMQLQSPDWFLDPEVMIKSKRLGLAIVEIDVEGKLRQGGSSNVRWTTCFEFLRNILRYRFGSPLRGWSGLRKHSTRAYAAAAPQSSHDSVPLAR